MLLGRISVVLKQHLVGDAGEGSSSKYNSRILILLVLKLSLGSGQAAYLVVFYLFIYFIAVV